AQNSPLVVSIVLGTGLAIFLLIFALIVLLILARRAQQARLDDAYRQLDRSAKLIRRYVPSQLADKIIKGEHSEDSRPERAKLTIFFSDLVGFSEIAEEMEPEDLSRVLNEYFSEMTAIAQKHGGTVDELSGDAILIFFGAPVATNDKDHALRAVRMATDMQQAMGALNARWRAAGITEVLQVRMGINTGVVTIGNFGSPDRMKYAALGKHVNLAARIQAECEPGRVLISQSTWLLVSDQVQCTPKGETQFKGIAKPVMTYELASA
ncbi:MAG: adenylate/guanylate cyclase domain-containing protein, partial [Burkholderiales bacterium]